MGGWVGGRCGAGGWVGGASLFLPRWPGAAVALLPAHAPTSVHVFPPPPALPLQRFVEDCGEDVSVEQAPQMQGRQMNMVLGPKKIQVV